MNSSDRQRIEHIEAYCKDVSGYISRFGDSFRTFEDDGAYLNAVSMCILQIGENANGLSEEFRNETKEQMQWGAVRGMRNWIAHAYTEVDIETIWSTAKNDLPNLERFCQKVLSTEKENLHKSQESIADKIDRIKHESER